MAMTHKSKVGKAVLLSAVALVVAACAPMFAAGAVLTTTPRGPLVVLSWGVATPDSGRTITNYRIDVDGQQVQLVPGGSTSCVLTGLASATTYSISVTAYDSAGEWSGSLGGDLAAHGTITASYTTPVSAGGGAVRACVPTTDTDGDRLPNAVETGGGTYVSAGNTGTSPTDADTDDDGLTDGDEALGTTAGLNLPGMGVRPVKRDILLEFDWFSDSTGCGPHSHRPTAAMVNSVSAAFASAPVANPDGSTGVNLVADYGQGGLFTGGSLVPDADGVIAGGVNGGDFVATKAAQFAAAREGSFHYVLMPHYYNTNSSSSGQAEIFGDDLIVSLYCYYGDTAAIANTIMHELGHNLGLYHGGNDNENNKPNYNSVMNYDFQFPGIDTNCDAVGDGVLSYSTGSRASLNENALLETNGVCGGVDLDWDGDLTIDPGAVAVDINSSATLTTLTDYNDWANLYLVSVDDGDGAPLGPNPVITEASVEDILHPR